MKNIWDSQRYLYSGIMLSGIFTRLRSFFKILDFLKPKKKFQVFTQENGEYSIF